MVRSRFYLFKQAVHDKLLTQVLGLAPDRKQKGGAATPPVLWEETARVGLQDIYGAVQYMSSFIPHCSILFDPRLDLGRD